MLWKGRHSLSGEAEEGKVKELEAQYRTACREIRQGCEDVDFVRALGGRLVSRQVSGAFPCRCAAAGRGAEFER